MVKPEDGLMVQVRCLHTVLAERLAICGSVRSQSSAVVGRGCHEDLGNVARIKPESMVS